MEQTEELRSYIKNILLKIRKEQKDNLRVELREEKALRKLIRKMLTEVKETAPHESTGINLLAKLLDNIIPLANNTYDLGSTVKRFNDIYSDTLTLGIFKTLTQQIESNLNTPYAIDTFPSSTFRTVKYIVQATSISGIHSTEVFCMQDGVTAYLTEYATLISGSALGNFSVGVASGNVNLTGNWFVNVMG